MALAPLNLEHVRGDSEDYSISIVDEDGAVVDLTKAIDGTASREAISRFAVMDDPATETNAQALVFKRSYVATEIEHLPLGVVHVIIDKPDTKDAEVKSYKWDLEVTRQDFVRTSAGLASVVAGSATVTGSATDFTKAKVGDVFQPLGVTNTRPVKVKSIESAGSMTVESSDVFSASESGIGFEIRRGRSRTARKGKYKITQDVVKE